MKPFSTITAIPASLVQRLDTLGFKTMTPIQQQAIPEILSGKDLLAHSETGSGKTLAFGIPLVMGTDPQTNTPSALIITPTRELASQIAQVLRELAGAMPNLKIITLYGGAPLRTQADSLRKGAHIIIGTPGRLIDHLGKGTLTLTTISTLVLDEADRMLDMGFYDEILKIASHTASARQTLLFSATFPPKIEKLAHTLLKEPVSIKIEASPVLNKNIEEIVYITSQKPSVLGQIISAYRPQSLLIFCNTKADVVTLEQRLANEGHDVCALHGDLSQVERDEAIIRFDSRTCAILVATDVASRGLDIEGIAMVINYDLPFEQEIYIHRIGRTGRANAGGIAISLYTEGSSKTDYVFQRAITKEVNKRSFQETYTMRTSYRILCLNGGKKSKLRAGDIIGAFCKEIGIDNTKIGKITITDTKSYVVLHEDVIEHAYTALKQVKIKKKRYIAWIIDHIN